MNGSLGNIHGLQFLGIARGNLKLGAGLVIMKVLLWNMDDKSLIYSSTHLSSTVSWKEKMCMENDFSNFFKVLSEQLKSRV